jgi:hypothetical protein
MFHMAIGTFPKKLTMAEVKKVLAANFEVE